MVRPVTVVLALFHFSERHGWDGLYIGRSYRCSIVVLAYNTPLFQNTASLAIAVMGLRHLLSMISDHFRVSFYRKEAVGISSYCDDKDQRFLASIRVG